MICFNAWNQMKHCLSVIMPAFNEQATLPDVIAAVLRQDAVAELIIINDASTDGTREVLEEIKKTDSRIRVFHHDLNQGKGAALRTGISHGIEGQASFSFKIEAISSS